MIAVLATYSMVALAASDRIAGELTVTGNANNGDAPSVTVNGEAARSGRTIFSSSIIATSANSGAVINLGKIGVVELAPNTTFTVNFDDKAISGDLTSGKITVLGTSAIVNVKTNGGQVKLSTGQSVNAAGKADDDDDAHGGAAWWVWAVIFGGAAAGILIAAIDADNRVALGGTATTISPVR
jgi:hypothetical protein